MKKLLKTLPRLKGVEAVLFRSKIRNSWIDEARGWERADIREHGAGRGWTPLLVVGVGDLVHAILRVLPFQAQHPTTKASAPNVLRVDAPNGRETTAKRAGRGHVWQFGGGTMLLQVWVRLAFGQLGTLEFVPTMFPMVSLAN